MNADRNLLFGVLALQLDFIDRDQLIAAMQAWMLEKSRSLEDILKETGALTSDAYELLVPLVDAHIRNHQGDVTLSLAGISSVEGIKQELQAVADADLEVSITYLSGSKSTDQSAPPKRTDRRTEQGRFRVIKPHAKGGLGQVSLAIDAELSREVALKEIQDRFADDDQCRQRFVVEAEITGGLEHPGIVPIYGLGHYQDGRPYYAMRFIKGDSLKQAVDNFHSTEFSDGTERSLQLRQLLGRFVDVCNAIEYAHARGVLHRDLKPGNIMLGKYGETLVVDWGLAKSVDRSEIQRATGDEKTLLPASASGSSATRVGSTVGTPGYMSPEQAAGKLDELGPASDVYSLGATLYYLLTGRSPFAAESLVQLLEKVEQGDFPTPRELASDVSPALNAICLRAMATMPADRYQSPRAVADDVERYLADEPVEALVEPVTIRVKRWMRKHPRTVAAIAATLLVGLTSTIVMITVISGKNAELASANNRLDARGKELAEANESLNSTIAQLNQANDALVVANEQEKEARKDAEQKQLLADSIRSFLQDDLLYQADVAEQFQRLSKSDEFDDLPTSNVTVRELVDRAARKLTNEEIEDKFPGQPLVQAGVLKTIGDTYSGVGAYQDAVDFLERALALYESELGKNDSLTISCLSNLALANQQNGQHARAIELFEETLSRSRQTNGIDHRLTLATMNNLASSVTSEGDYKRGLAMTKEALEKLTSVFGETDKETLRCKNNLALAYSFTAEYDETVTILADVLEHTREAYGDDHPFTLTCMTNLGTAHEAAGQSARSLEVLTEALQRLRRTLSPTHPKLLTCLRSMANTQRSLGAFEQAKETLTEITSIAKETLGPEHPSTLGFMFTLAQVQIKMGNWAQATPLLEEILESAKKELGEKHANTLACMGTLAMAYKMAGQFTKAQQLYEKQTELQSEIYPPNHPAVLTARHNLAASYRAQGEGKKAVEILEDVLRKTEEAAGLKHPMTIQILGSLGDAYDVAENLDKSIETYQEMIKRSRESLGENDVNTLQGMSHLGITLLDNGDVERAIPLFEDATQRMKANLGEDNVITLDTLYHLGRAYESSNRIDAAIETFQQVLNEREKKFGELNSDTLKAMARLAGALLASDQMDKAFELQTRLVSGSSEFYGEDHGLTLKRKADLGLIYIQKDQLEQGITLLEEALADPSRHKSLPSYSPSLAFAYARAGKRDEAIRLIGQSIAQARVNLPEKSADLARKLVAGARVLNEVQDWETAQTYLREASDVILVELPDQVELGNVKAALGTTLLGLAEKLGEEDERRQALLVEAETCLTEGVAILKEKSASMPANVREPRIVETLEALVRLYTIWNLPDKAKPWRVELDARQVN